MGSRSGGEPLKPLVSPWQEEVSQLTAADGIGVILSVNITRGELRA
jgi:hypothetical protein